MRSTVQRVCLLTFLTGSLLPPACAAQSGEDQVPPNILLIVADDLCWRDLGLTGNPDVQSPHLDRLAKEGMRLTHLFSSSATCSPTRHALYTGLYPLRSKAYPNHTRVADGVKSVFHYLGDLGYSTALVGKRHVGPRKSFPFQYLGDNAASPEAAIKYIRRRHESPWFLVYASHNPHRPWDRGPEDLYDPQKIEVPAYLHDNATTRRLLAAYYAEITALDREVGKCLQALDDSGQTENTLVVFVSEQGSGFPYGGKWTLYDNGVRTATVARWPGRIRANTRNDALAQYVDLVPTFVAVAGGDPTQIDTGSTDANGSNRLDGRDISGLLLGKSEEGREYVFAQHTTLGVIGAKQPYPSRSVRDRRYKLIRNLAPDNVFHIHHLNEVEPLLSWQDDAADDPRLAERIKAISHRPAEELYDLEADEFEMRNLADDPQYADVKQRLQTSLDGWMAQQGDRGLESELKANASDR